MFWYISFVVTYLTVCRVFCNIYYLGPPGTGKVINDKRHLNLYLYSQYIIILYYRGIFYLKNLLIICHACMNVCMCACLCVRI